MSCKLEINATIHCPRCGRACTLKELDLLTVEHYRVGDRNGHDRAMLRITASTTHDLPWHDCIVPPPTDGLRPIERFVMHEALDDMGATE